MGLAERFKDKLEKKDIFQQKNNSTNPIENNSNIVYISPSTSQENETIEQNNNIINPINNILKTNPIKEPQRYKFENLENLIIVKIRNTPYWTEYSLQKQESMINSFINKKGNTYNFTEEEKKEFINNILVLTNKI